MVTFCMKRSTCPAGRFGRLTTLSPNIKLCNATSRMQQLQRHGQLQALNPSLVAEFIEQACSRLESETLNIRIELEACIQLLSLGTVVKACHGMQPRRLDQCRWH